MRGEGAEGCWHRNQSSYAGKKALYGLEHCASLARFHETIFTWFALEFLHILAFSRRNISIV
jgi:hypothetical protein